MNTQTLILWINQLGAMFYDALERCEDFLQEVLSHSTRKHSLSEMAEYQGATVEIMAVDISGTMEIEDYPPSRLAGAKKAGTQFLQRLASVNPSAAVGIVSFGTKAKVVCQPLGVKENLTKLKESLGRLRIDGCTNISDALKVAGEQINRIPDVKNPRILLLTDGHSNEGGDPKPVAKCLKENGVQLDQDQAQFFY